MTELAAPHAAKPGSDDDVANRLEAFLEPRIRDADDVIVTRLTRSTEGFSQETFSVDVEVRRGQASEARGYVVKREPVAGLLEPYDLQPEFRVLHALSDDPLPSPPTPWFERDPIVLDRPFYVMERLPGDVPIPAVSLDGRGPFDDDARMALAPQVADALARLHAIDWRAHGFEFLGVPSPGRGAAERELERWRDRMARSGLPLDPIVAESLLWLRRNLPSTDEVTLVHGDYRLGNFLVVGLGRPAVAATAPGDVRLSGILDWEMVHLGDPIEDLAWCACPLWRAGTEYASGLVPPAELAAMYAAASGRAVDDDRYRFYEVLAVVKMIAIMMTGVRAFMDGRTRDIRMAIFDHQLPYLNLMLAMLRNLFSGG